MPKDNRPDNQSILFSNLTPEEVAALLNARNQCPPPKDNQPDQQCPPAKDNQTDQQCFLFSNLSPAEVSLLASVIGIVLASDLSDEDASTLSTFLFGIGSSISIFVDRRSRETTPPAPL